MFIYKLRSGKFYKRNSNPRQTFYVISVTPLPNRTEVEIVWRNWNEEDFTWSETVVGILPYDIGFSGSEIEWIGTPPPELPQSAGKAPIVKRPIPENARRSYDCAQCGGRTKEVVLLTSSSYWCPRCEL